MIYLKGMTKIFRLVIILFLSVVFSGCLVKNDQKIINVNRPPEFAKSAQEVVGKYCEKNDDCPLPMDYAIRSNCPYAAFCERNKCVVACPLWQHSANTNESISYKVACKNGSDCDCRQTDQEDKYRCACLSEQCVSVVAE